MGGGANNKAVHTWARKFNMTTGSLVKDWEDEEEGEEDFQREKQQQEDERAEMEEAEQEFFGGSAEEDNERRRVELDWEEQAEVLELGERVAKALKVLTDLPPLEEVDPDREKLMAWGEDLKRSADGYFLKPLRTEVGPFEAAVEKERKEAPEKSRLQHDWEAQADVLEFGDKVDAALETLGKLPPIPARAEGRSQLVRQGDALKNAVDNYELKRLGREVPGFLDAVRKEEAETREAVRAAEEIKGLFGEVVEMLEAAGKIPGVLPVELKPLDGVREGAKSATEKGDLTALKKLHLTCSETVDGLLTDKAAIQNRLETLVSGKKPDKLVSEVWDLFQKVGGQRKDLGVGQPAWKKVVSLQYTPPSVYKITDRQDCIDHAIARHTFEGILRADKILTAHVSMVAIFDNDSDLSRAVNSVSTDPRDWFPLRNGFNGCDVGRIRLYGGINGDTVSLQTCFPLGGAAPEYDQATVQMALNHAQGSLADFKRLVKGEISPEELEEERQDKLRKEREEREKEKRREK